MDFLQSYQSADPNLASFRNLRRVVNKLLSSRKSRRAEGPLISLDGVSKKLQRSTDRFKEYQKALGDRVCCPLPLSLQDLSLLVVVCDLDLHEVCSLASLPGSVRHRLLSVLPAIDLARLESTPVAAGVDVAAIWGSRREMEEKALNPVVRRALRPRSGDTELESVSTLLVCSVQSLKDHHRDLLKEFLLQSNRIENSLGKEFLVSMASKILYTDALKPEDFDVLANKLISVQGEVLLSNMLTGIMHQPCPNAQCSNSVWRNQTVGLLVDVNSLTQPRLSPSLFGVRGYRDVRLTPVRLLDILYMHDPMQLLISLTKECNLQPSSAVIHIEEISKLVLKDLCEERLALDSGFSLPNDSATSTCTSIFNHFLGNVAVLLLQCDTYSNIGVTIGMIKAATTKGDESQLKHLFCILPDIYMDVVEPCVSLYSLKRFQTLTIEVSRAYPLMFIKILQGFMSVPSANMQRLVICSKSGVALPSSLQIDRLASFGVATALPHSVAQHKALQCSSKEEFTKVLYLLLQLPTVRLKEIALLNIEEYHQYIHLCAVHPDLEMTKLVIDWGYKFTLAGSTLPTIQADLVSLFKKKALEKIVIVGCWGSYVEVKEGLVHGLRCRISLPPLKKLALELEIADSYKMRDFQLLCDAIFSLPQLQNLKLVLGKGFVDIMQNQRGYESILSKSWNRKASGVQLKSVCLPATRGMFKQLQLVTRDLSFSYEKRQRPQKSSSSAYFGGYYSYRPMWYDPDYDPDLDFKHDDDDYYY